MTEKQVSSPKLAVKDILTLFGVMFKIGCTCFGGGWSIVAQMDQEFVQKRQWTTSEELMNYAVIAKGIPGIMIMNATILFSYSVAGWIGAVAAVLGCAAPSIGIILILSRIYEAFKTNGMVISAMTGVRASVVAIVTSVSIRMWKIAIVDKRTIVIAAVVFLLCFTSVSKATLMVGAVLAGALDYLLQKRNRL